MTVETRGTPQKIHSSKEVGKRTGLPQAGAIPSKSSREASSNRRLRLSFGKEADPSVKWTPDY